MEDKITEAMEKMKLEYAKQKESCYAVIDRAELDIEHITYQIEAIDRLIPKEMSSCMDAELEKQHDRVYEMQYAVNELPMADWFKAKVLDFIFDYECKEDEPAKFED